MKLSRDYLLSCRNPKYGIDINHKGELSIIILSVGGEEGRDSLCCENDIELRIPSLRVKGKRLERIIKYCEYYSYNGEKFANDHSIDFIISFYDAYRKALIRVA